MINRKKNERQEYKEWSHYWELKEQERTKEEKVETKVENTKCGEKEDGELEVGIEGKGKGLLKI